MPGRRGWGGGLTVEHGYTHHLVQQDGSDFMLFFLTKVSETQRFQDQDLSERPEKKLHCTLQTRAQQDQKPGRVMEYGQLPVVLFS